MAGFSILVVPTNRDFIPDPDAVEAAAELLESYYPEREHGADEQDFETPRLVTARDAFDSIKCPSCGQSIERWELEEDDDGDTWWTLFEAKLGDSKDAPAEAVEMPCCGAEVKAGDLELGAEAAFARFVLSIRDPGEPVLLQPSQETAIGKLLGCEVKGIVEVRG
jgi:hypothetical protein